MVLVVRTSPVWCAAVSTRSGGTRLGGSGFGGVLFAVAGAGAAGLRWGALGAAGLAGVGLVWAADGAGARRTDVNRSRQERSTGPPRKNTGWTKVVERPGRSRLSNRRVKTAWRALTGTGNYIAVNGFNATNR